MDIIYKETCGGLDQQNLVELWHSVGWYEGSALDPARLLASMRNSGRVVTAWDGKRLVGLCSSITDSLNVWISYMVVHAGYQGTGIGTELLRRNISCYGDCRLYVQTVNASGFYQASGFVETMVSLKRDGFLPSIGKMKQKGSRR